MTRTFLIVLLIGIWLPLAGCGDFEFLPDAANNGPTPIPPPSGDVVTDVQADTVIKFLQYTVAGLADATSSIRVGGDPGSQYIVNGGAPTAAAGTVKNGDTVIVQHTSSNLGANLSLSTVLVIGGASASYISTTGTLIFPTLRGVNPGTIVTSNTATIPATLPNGFIFGTSSTIAFATDSNPGSLMFINGNTFPAASPSPIAAGNTLTLRHTTAAGAGQTVTTKAILTASNGVAYTLTFKSTTQ